MKLIQLLITSILLCASSSLMAGHPMPNEAKHESIDVPDGVAKPQLSVEVFEDMMDGFNLHIITHNFQLEAPEFAKDKPEAGVQGHAHLYINQQKIRRLYGPYVHIPSALLKPGMNIIAVTINDHMHNTWRVEGQEMIVAIILNTELEEPVQSIHSPFPVK